MTLAGEIEAIVRRHVRAAQDEVDEVLGVAATDGERGAVAAAAALKAAEVAAVVALCLRAGVRPPYQGVH